MCVKCSSHFEDAYIDPAAVLQPQRFNNVKGNWLLYIVQLFVISAVMLKSGLVPDGRTVEADHKRLLG